MHSTAQANVRWSAAFVQRKSKLLPGLVPAPVVLPALLAVPAAVVPRGGAGRGQGVGSSGRSRGGRPG
eukprot:1637242-Lingulodinium_polyedra.AAC.1